MFNSCGRSISETAACTLQNEFIKEGIFSAAQFAVFV